MSQQATLIQEAISKYFVNRNKYDVDFPIQESIHPSFEQLKDSTELQEVLSALPETSRETTLKTVVDDLIAEGILDDKKFPGGLYHIIVADITARNFQIAVDRGEVTLSEEDFKNSCEPLTLLVRLMSTKPSRTAKNVDLCNFYAKELERISINIEKEGDNFCGIAALPSGVFFGSEQVQMKFYYFQKKDNKLYPVMNYELHVNPKGLGWFVFKFTEHEKVSER